MKHGLSRDEGGGAEGDGELVAGAVVVAGGLAGSVWHDDGVEGGDARGVVLVEGSIDVPSVEAGVALGFVFLGDAGFVERGVRGVFEGGDVEAFVVGHCAVADELNLAHARDGLEVWVEYRLCGGFGLVVAMPVAL